MDYTNQNTSKSNYRKNFNNTNNSNNSYRQSNSRYSKYPTRNNQNRTPYNPDSPIEAFGFSFSLKDFENWEKNRVYNVSKEIQYKAIINTINTSLPQFIIYYYFKNLGFDCEYELKTHIPENILNKMESPRNYTLDLFNPDKKLVIEYDGKEFHKDNSKDIERDRKILTGPIFENPIAKYIIRIREGYLLYKGQNTAVKEYRINQRNQGFNTDYQNLIKDIYIELVNKFGTFQNTLDLNNLDVVKDEPIIRCAYFEYAEKIIEQKGENIFDYYPYKEIIKLYKNANRQVPQEIKDKHLAFAMRTAYNYNMKFVIEAISKEYHDGDTFYQLLQRLETKYPTLKRAELCDSNRIVIQDATTLVISCKKLNNEILLNDLITGKIDNKAQKTLVLSDTKTQLDFVKKYDGVENEYYDVNKFKLMNYRKNQEGQICPNPNALLLHKIKYEEEEWGLWHEIQSLAKEYNISPIQAIFKKININNEEFNEAKVEINNTLSKKEKVLPQKYFDHFLGIPQQDIFNGKDKVQNINENNKDILNFLYRNKSTIADFLRYRSDFFKDFFLNKTDDEIFKIVQKGYIAEKQDDRYKRKEELNKNLSFATSLGVNSLNTLFVSAKDSDDLNKMVNSYKINASTFKSALAHDYIMKKDYNLETTQLASIIKSTPDLFPDMKDMSLEEINKTIMPIVMEKKWSSLVHPYFINTQTKNIHNKMDKISAFKSSKDSQSQQKKPVISSENNWQSKQQNEFSTLTALTSDNTLKTNKDKETTVKRTPRNKYKYSTNQNNSNYFKNSHATESDKNKEKNSVPDIELDL